MLARDSSQTSRQAKSGTPAPGTTGSTQTLYKWLNDFTMKHVESKMKATGAGAWLWLVLIGIFVGLIHVLIPGHGKGVIASYVVATHSRPATAVQLALMITLVHTISTLVLATFIMVLAEVYLPTTVQNVAVIYLTLVSGGLIGLIGVYMLFFFNPLKWTKEEEKEKKLVEETLEGEKSRKSHFSLMWKVAAATGIIPCITSSYAATLFIAYREYSKAFLMILFIALGQAITLSIIGAVASGFFRGLRWMASKEKGGFFTGIVKHLHKPTAVILILCGLYGVYLGWGFFRAAKASVQPMTADERIAAYEEGLKKKPGDFEAHFNLGLLYAAKDKLGESLEHFRKASELKPEDPEPVRFAAHALARMEKYEEAVQAYDEALKLSPADGNLLFNLAYVEEKLDKTDQALEHYAQAAEGGEPKASFNIGLIYQNRSLLDQALEHYLKAAEARPDNVRFRMAVANTYYNMKQYDKAAEHLLLAREKEPLSSALNLQLANIYLRRFEKEDEAKPFVEAYLQNGGRSEIDGAVEQLAGQSLTTPSYQKWKPPASVKEFERIGACALPCLDSLVRSATGEQLKTVLAAVAATEAPQALCCVIDVLNDTERWTEQDLFGDYGPGLGTPPVPVIAKHAFMKCMRTSCVPKAVRELLRVYGENNNREYFLKQLYMDCCLDHPFEFMDAVLDIAGTVEDQDLFPVVDLALSLKGEPLAVATDPDTLKACLRYLTGWWGKNRETVVWDKGNLCFTRKE
jgi:tetratricopeptide (TPR) repeat protein